MPIVQTKYFKFIINFSYVQRHTKNTSHNKSSDRDDIIEDSTKSEIKLEIPINFLFQNLNIFFNNLINFVYLVVNLDKRVKIILVKFEGIIFWIVNWKRKFISNNPETLWLKTKKRGKKKMEGPIQFPHYFPLISNFILHHMEPMEYNKSKIVEFIFSVYKRRILRIWYETFLLLECFIQLIFSITLKEFL